MDITQVTPASPLLELFEEVAVINDGAGLIDIKPFRDWKGSKWQNSVFTFRLCNAGEILDIAEYCARFPETARIQATKIEYLLRSIFAINNNTLLTSEQLNRHNEKHNTSYDRNEYLRQWFRNIEEVTLDRLDAILGALRDKQIRQLNRQYMCEVSGEVFTEIPEDSWVLRYSVGEIVSPQYVAQIQDPEYFEISHVHKTQQKANNETSDNTDESPPAEPNETPTVES